MLQRRSLTHLALLSLLEATMVTLSTAQTQPENDEGSLTRRIQALPSPYALGSGDQLVIRAIDVADISDKPVRIDETGHITLPLIGRVRAADLTIHQLELDLDRRLRQYVLDPQVAVSITELRSQPVSIIGAVNQPGVHQLQGDKTLLEILSLAGGLRQDAGPTVKITRERVWGAPTVVGAKLDSGGEHFMAEVSVKELIQGSSSNLNIPIRPRDVIAVPVGELVYVIGEVRKPGGFVLNSHETLSVLQALSMAEGLARTADAKHAKILRKPANNQPRVEIAVNMKGILEGKSPDLPVQPNDILFVPNSMSRSAALRTLEAAIQIGTGIAIWRP